MAAHAGSFLVDAPPRPGRASHRRGHAGVQGHIQPDKPRQIPGSLQPAQHGSPAGVSVCHGLTSCSAHTRATVLWLTPSSAAGSREDQCATPRRSGGGASVVARISARRVRRTVWERPRRGRSASSEVSPSSPGGWPGPRVRLEGRRRTAACRDALPPTTPSVKSTQIRTTRCNSASGCDATLNGCPCCRDPLNRSFAHSAVRSGSGCLVAWRLAST
jgi:hypothetical protein